MLDWKADWSTSQGVHGRISDGRNWRKTAADVSRYNTKTNKRRLGKSKWHVPYQRFLLDFVKSPCLDNDRKDNLQNASVRETHHMLTRTMRWPMASGSCTPSLRGNTTRQLSIRKWWSCGSMSSLGLTPGSALRDSKLRSMAYANYGRAFATFCSSGLHARLNLTWGAIMRTRHHKVEHLVSFESTTRVPGTVDGEPEASKVVHEPHLLRLPTCPHAAPCNFPDLGRVRSIHVDTHAGVFPHVLRDPHD